MELHGVSTLSRPAYRSPLLSSDIIERINSSVPTPFLILDTDQVAYRYRLLKHHLPGVELFYAMKSLPEIEVVRTLHSLGGKFDVATTGEIRMLESIGVKGDEVIHTHPMKKSSDIEAAMDFGCRHFVVDNPVELRKFIPYRNEVSLILRLGFANATSVVNLSKKFGCAPNQALGILSTAKDLGINVDAFSFHVGSQSLDPSTYVNAIQVCAYLIEEARTLGLAEIGTLDIGGGFPTSYNTDQELDYDSFFTPIRKALAALPSGIRTIAEPGRFISGPVMTSIASVVGKSQRGSHMWYYLDDGVYGSYSGQIYDHAQYPVEVLKPMRHLQPSVLAGPTCDSVDVIAEGIALPELDIGDLVIGRIMGAYTYASASDFNFVPKAKVVYISSSTGTIKE